MKISKLKYFNAEKCRKCGTTRKYMSDSSCVKCTMKKINKVRKNVSE